MNIIVTGGEGFIGKHLVKKLNELEHRVLVLDKKSGVDITTSLILNGDALVHLAAIHNVQYTNQHPKETFDTNVYGTYNLLKNSDVKKFVFVSSSVVYEKNSSVYAMTKHLGEEMVKHSGLDYVILRLFNVYGPGCSGLISNLIKARDTQTPLRLYGDGEQTRDFIHVDDVCNAVIKSLGAYPRAYPWVYDVGTGKSHSVNQVIELFQKINSQKNGNKVQVERHPELKEVKHSKSNPILYTPKITLEEGLRTL